MVEAMKAMQESMKTLSNNTKDITRAIESLREELDAVDVYNQRAELATDEELRKLMIHNRNEEIEHAAMIIEWLRRTIPEFDHELKDYLFTEGSLEDIEAQATSGDETQSSSSLKIGNLK